MAIPTSGELYLGNSTSTRSIKYEMWRSVSGEANLRTLSSEANKSTEDAMSEFYGFNGLCTMTMTTSVNTSDPGGNFKKCVTISDSNLLGRTLGMRVIGRAAVFRNSSGSPTSGSLGAVFRISSPSASSTTQWITGTGVGVKTGTTSDDFSYTTSSATIVIYLYCKEPTPLGPCNIAYTSVSISSFWGNCYATSSGSPVSIST